MIASNNIHPPKNWQDFEMLCLKLWGEVWEIPHEIDFNSDNAQGQHGVDIYGPVDDAKKYYGIQCKNRKLNLIDGEKNRLSISDINAEIEKALKFQPPLSKLIIATSLYKDQKIEQHVRLKSLEHVSKGLFPIQICFWEFFERKITEFQKVYDWYIKNERFHTQSNLSVTLEDGSLRGLYNPRYQRNLTIYQLEKQLPQIPVQPEFYKHTGLAAALKNINAIHPSIISNYYQTKDWIQRHWFKLYIHNTGQTTLEDFKIELDFAGEFTEVGPSEGNPLYGHHVTNVNSYSNSKKSLWIGPQRVLVQSDGFYTGSIYLDPLMNTSGNIKMEWRLLARDFVTEGELQIDIEPKYYSKTTFVDVTDPSEVRTEESISFIQRRGHYNTINGFTYDDSPDDFPIDS